MSPRRRRAGAVAALVAVAVMLAACGTVRATRRTTSALRRGGFPGATVGANQQNSFTTVTVRLRQAGGPESDNVAAGVVWRTFDLRLDEVNVLRPIGGRRFSREVLESRFGPRPASFDRRTVGRDAVRTAGTVGVIVVIAGVVTLVVVLVVVILIVRSVRRRRANQPQAPAGQYPPGGYPPGPYQQGPYPPGPYQQPPYQPGPYPPQAWPPQQPQPSWAPPPGQQPQPGWPPPGQQQGQGWPAPPGEKRQEPGASPPPGDGGS